MWICRSCVVRIGWQMRQVGHRIHVRRVRVAVCASHTSLPSSSFSLFRMPLALFLLLLDFFRGIASFVPFTVGSFETKGSDTYAGNILHSILIFLFLGLFR